MRMLISTMLRTRRGFLLAWLLPLAGLVLLGGAAFPVAYPNSEDLQALSANMSSNGGLRALYGIPADTVSVGSLIAWEIGMFVLILGSVMAILLAVGISRAWEEDGITEIVRSSGISRRQPTLAAALVSAVVALALGLIVFGVLVFSRVFTSDISVSGSLALGAVTAVSTATAASIALIAAQSFNSARSARLAALACLGASYAIRAIADIWNIDWLRWLSILGWRDVVRPFSADTWWPLIVMATVAAFLFALSLVLADRRDLGAVWFALPPSTSKKVADVQAMSRIGLRGRLERPNAIGWGVAVAALGAMFASMTGEMTNLLGSSAQTEELVRQMGLADDLEQIYLTLIGTVTFVLICCMVVQLITAIGTEERSGFLTPLWTSGVRHPAPILDTAVSTVVATGMILVVTIAAMSGVVALTAQNSGSASFAALSMAGQIPGAVAILGISMLITAAAPKLAWLAWIPLGASGLFTLYGQLLKLPDWLLNCSVLAHPVYDSNGWHWLGPLVLVIIGAIAAALVPAVMARRDLAS